MEDKDDGKGRVCESTRVTNNGNFSMEVWSTLPLLSYVPLFYVPLSKKICQTVIQHIIQIYWNEKNELQPFFVGQFENLENSGNSVVPFGSLILLWGEYPKKQPEMLRFVYKMSSVYKTKLRNCQWFSKRSMVTVKGWHICMMGYLFYCAKISLWRISNGGKMLWH